MENSCVKLHINTILFSLFRLYTVGLEWHAYQEMVFHF